MSKYIALLLLFLVAPFSFSQDLTASLKMPEVIVPGEDYTVEVTVNKGEINSYIKFLQKLPPGFFASALDVNGGNFSFQDSVVKIVWLFPPASNEFAFSYKVNVPDELTGEEKVAGKIFYFFNTNRESYSFKKRYLNDGNRDTVLVSNAIPKVPDTLAIVSKIKQDSVSVVDSASLASLVTKIENEGIENNVQDTLITDSSKVVSISSGAVAIYEEEKLDLEDVTAIDDAMKKDSVIQDREFVKVEEKMDSLITSINKDTVETAMELPVKNTNELAEMPSKPDTILTETVSKTEALIEKELPHSDNTEASTAKVEINKEPAPDNDRLYAVQIGAFLEEVPLETANKFLTVSARGVKNLKDNNGITTYIVGEFNAYEEAIGLKKELLDNGFYGSYIIAYPNKNVETIPKKLSVEKKIDKTAKPSVNVVAPESMVEKETNNSEKEKVKTANSHNPGKTYKIQLGAFLEDVPLETANKFIQIGAKGVKNLKDDRGYTVYSVGDFSIRSEADDLKKTMIEKGFVDAYVITFENGKLVR